MNSPVEITCLYIVIPILMVSLIFITIRFVNSHELLDRVVAVDMFVAVIIGLIIVFSIVYKVQDLVDVIIVLAILTFLSTVAFSYYYQKHKR